MVAWQIGSFGTYYMVFMAFKDAVGSPNYSLSRNRKAEGERRRTCIWRVEKRSCQKQAHAASAFPRFAYTGTPPSNSFLHNKLPHTAPNGCLRYLGKPVHVRDSSGF